MEKTIQGTILSLGAGTIASGITLISQHDMIVGIPLILVGFALVYWRENRKIK